MTALMDDEENRMAIWKTITASEQISKKKSMQEKRKNYKIMHLKDVNHLQMAEGPWRHRPEFLPSLVIYTIAFVVSTHSSDHAN